MKFRCLFRGHVWVTGRAASSFAASTIERRKSYHNRACCHCGKEEWNADEAEAEAERIAAIREMLGETRKIARMPVRDLRGKPLDPNEFP